MNRRAIPDHCADGAAAPTESSTTATSPTAWKDSPLLSLEWRLDRVREYLNRLPLAEAEAAARPKVPSRLPASSPSPPGPPPCLDKMRPSNNHDQPIFRTLRLQHGLPCIA